MILTVGESEKADVSFNGEKGKIKWKTSNKKVATVSSKGKVKALKPGTAKIDAYLEKGNTVYKSDIKVSVQKDCFIRTFDKKSILGFKEKIAEVRLPDNTRIVTKKSKNIHSECRREMKNSKRYIDITNAPRKMFDIIERGYKYNKRANVAYYLVFVHIKNKIYKVDAAIGNGYIQELGPDMNPQSYLEIKEEVLKEEYNRPYVSKDSRSKIYEKVDASGQKVTVAQVGLVDDTKVVTKNSKSVRAPNKKIMEAGKQYIDITKVPTADLNLITNAANEGFPHYDLYLVCIKNHVYSVKPDTISSEFDYHLEPQEFMEGIQQIK